MKWLITGGAGFIGTNAAALLVNAGDECVVADNFHRPGATYNQTYLRERFGLAVDYLDVRFADQVTAYWSAHRDVDVILHLAGQVSLLASLSDPRYDFETNALGTFNVLEAARKFSPEAKLMPMPKRHLGQSPCGALAGRSPPHSGHVRSFTTKRIALLLCSDPIRTEGNAGSVFSIQRSFCSCSVFFDR